MIDEELSEINNKLKLIDETIMARVSKMWNNLKRFEQN
jgi:hypothetical protein